jgi:hypothetical protein
MQCATQQKLNRIAKAGYTKIFNNKNPSPYTIVTKNTPLAVLYLLVLMYNVNKAILATRHQALKKVISLLSSKNV